MAIIKDKRAMALPFVLGIVTFVIGLVATLISYAVFQSRLITKNIESTESYQNAVQSINATIHVIVREKNLDPTFLTNLANYMGVTITSYSPTVWVISDTVSDTLVVKSYISGTDASISVVNEQFAFTGEELDYVQNTYITAESLLYNYVSQFLKSIDPTLNPPLEYTNYNAVFSTLKNDYSTFSSSSINPVFLYFTSATQSLPGYSSLSSHISSNTPITNNRFVSGNVTVGNNATLEVADGNVLVIDGSLTMNQGSTIKGVVLVNGNVSIKEKRGSIQTVEGTIYSDGSISMSGTTYLGPVSRPSFLISTGSITIGTDLYGYGYLIADSTNIGWFDDVSLTGGIYPYPSSWLLYTVVSPNTELDENSLLTYGIAASITDPTTSVVDNFTFTSPK